MHGLPVYQKEGLPFARDSSLENSADSYICFQLALLHSVFYLFSSIYHLLQLCAQFLILFPLTQMRFSQSTHLLMLFFGDFNVHHKDWLTYSDGTHQPDELCYNVSISNNLTQMVNFPTRIQDCDSHSPALFDLFLLMLVFVLQWLSLH